jgi:hypothetical protein
VVRDNTLHHAYDHGHWVFRERLHRLGLPTSPRCNYPLNEPGTPEHIIYECTKYNGIRNLLRERALVEKAGVVYAKRVLQGLRCARGHHDATEDERRATSLAVSLIVRNII